MNLQELRDVQNRERATDSLQELRDSFYADVAAYIGDLKDERDRIAAEADNPWSNPEISQLTDEIESAEQVAEAIYERRVGKVVKQASFAAAGMTGEVKGLTAEERDLYDDLVDRIRGNKTHVLDVLAGTGDVAGAFDDAPVTERDGPPADATEPAATDDDSGVAAADLMGSGPGDGESDPAPGADGDGDARGTSTAPVDADGEAATPGEGEDRPEERATLRITRDVGEIFGVDERVYSLESDDVVTLPEENATPLIERDAAERL